VVYAIQGTVDADFGGFTVDIDVTDSEGVVTTEGGGDYLYVVGGQNLTLGQVFTNSTNMFISDALIATSQFV